VCSRRCVRVPPSLNFSQLLSAFTYFLLPLSPHTLTAHARDTGREYATADIRWGAADPTVVALKLLTVFGPVPLSVLIVYQIVKGDPARYYWIIVLSTAKLYGGYVATISPRGTGRWFTALRVFAGG
jgi:EXPERA (EXPanded EBP superfamily)